jgi:hypothetical protein
MKYCWYEDGHNDRMLVHEESMSELASYIADREGEDELVEEILASLEDFGAWQGVDKWTMATPEGLIHEAQELMHMASMMRKGLTTGEIYKKLQDLPR